MCSSAREKTKYVSPHAEVRDHEILNTHWHCFVYNWLYQRDRHRLISKFIESTINKYRFRLVEHWKIIAKHRDEEQKVAN